jgi:predicted  nucleic acid-binding Zn-ribbon protein
MNPDLEKLIRLQRADSELRRAETELAEVPKRRGDLEARLVAERSRLDAAKGELAESQKARRQHESELQDLEAKRSKYSGQLMDVKTNKEYTAMLHEIENVKHEIRLREDQILAEMEKAETLSSEIKREETAFKEAETRSRDEGKVLDSRAATLQQQTARLTSDRDAIAGTLSEDVLELFRRVARLRGTGVSEAKDGMCQVCHVKLRLQMYSELKRNEEIQQCPACNRILYYEAPVVAETPTP